MVAVDLGAAPGSWCQVLRERLGPKAMIVAVDVLPMDPVAGVTFVQADFSTDEGLDAVESTLDGLPVDLVLSTWPPTSRASIRSTRRGAWDWRIWALAFAADHLQPGGDFAVKVFQGAGLAEFEKAMRGRFAKVYVRKPKASRDRSREVFLVGKGYAGR
ncbi:MAG: RlmE family RNA methyltransferase [Burkholderiales bacterium]